MLYDVLFYVKMFFCYQFETIYTLFKHIIFFDWIFVIIVSKTIICLYEQDSLLKMMPPTDHKRQHVAQSSKFPLANFQGIHLNHLRHVCYYPT